MEHSAMSLKITEEIQRQNSLRTHTCSDSKRTKSARADKCAILWQQSIGSARAGQCARCRFMERRAIESRKLAHVMESVGAGARRHGAGVGSFHEWRARRPKLLETQIAMQAHAANARHRRAQRSDRDAALFGEVGAVNRRGSMKCEILVDPANQAAVAPACKPARQFRRSAAAEHLVDGEQQALLHGKRRARLL